MHRRLLQRLLVLAAFAAALLLPARAHAAILPACDARELVTIAPLVQIGFFGDAEGACVVAGDEPGAEAKIGFGALCDPRGASMIAPQRVLPVSDMRFESAPGCAALDLSMQSIGPAPNDTHTMGASAALSDPAALGAMPAVGPAASELGPAYLPRPGVALPGVARAVYHPPR